MKNLLKTNTKIILAITIALALVPLTFIWGNGVFEFILLTKKPILSGALAFISILLSIKTNSYFSQQQRQGLSIFFLLIPFSFYFANHTIDFFLIKLQPAIAMGYFGIGLALLFNSLKIKRTANKT